MNFNLSLDLVVYGLVLIGLSFVAKYLEPKLAGASLVVGITGGALCSICGICGLRGFGKRFYPIGMLLLLAIFLGAQAVVAWLKKASEQSDERLAIIFIIATVLTAGQLINILKGENRNPTDE